jgi:hypothetical protein
MGHHARLRKALVARRGHAAAVAGATVLALTGSQAAGDAGPAWSKDWAEQQLRKHFGADNAVCLPIGRSTRTHGSAAFEEFVCVLVTRDGTRYTIHLKPRSRVAWSTLSITREHPGRAPGTRPGKAGAHALRDYAGSPATEAGSRPEAHN